MYAIKLKPVLKRLLHPATPFIVKIYLQIVHC